MRADAAVVRLGRATRAAVRRNEPGLIHYHQSIETLMHQPDVRDHRALGGPRPGGASHQRGAERSVVLPGRRRRERAGSVSASTTNGSPPTTARRYTHHSRSVSARLNRLRAGVLGANDGIVSTAALVIGVTAATTGRSRDRQRGAGRARGRRVVDGARRVRVGQHPA